MLQVVAHARAAGNALHRAGFVDLLQHGPGGQAAHIHILFVGQHAHAHALEHAVGNGGGGAGFAVGFLHVNQGGEQAVHPLILPQGQHLILPGGENHPHGGIVAVGNILQLDGGGGEPGIAAGPLGLGEIMPPVEGPAVVEQAGDLVLQVADVDKELVLRLVNPLGVIQYHAGLGQEQANHEQRVAPQLLVVLVPHGAVLQPAELGAGHFLQHPFGPAFNHGQIGGVAGFVIQAGEGQHGGHGVHVAVGLLLPGQHVIIPAGQVVQDGLVAALLIGLVDAVEGHAGGPLPVVHGQVSPGGIVAVGTLEHIQHLIGGCLVIHG